MANVLKPYGPDRQKTLTRGNAAFAFCLHNLTPEDLFERQPLLLETSMPGVFAVGDLRHGGVRRVASAVGEGSIAVQLRHPLFDAEPRQPRATV